MLPTLTPPDVAPIRFIDAYAAIRSTVVSAEEMRGNAAADHVGDRARS